MNNYFGTRVIFSSSCYQTKVVTRSFQERWFTFPWHPFQKTRTERVPGIFRIGGEIIAHPDLAEEIYRIMNREEDAPTLKVQAVK